ncbi:response regulator of citrate/malate metabolism [Desulfosporosinus acidiphilus SJ4]|uniref:Response regulator of citrate/malate metabolism n=1 Tax=Desulfosporosinus acidiphilus (strain DSM 22704 / JCM 16185 / SJ4) TaxID=646529 RepID=I4D0P6_DESAJ|nr:cache domain-containing protein [Desulfosporosinus acidiphilus]AFM39370.1 response regulator of citrate/malate metabolism [Desulfosporosinus acidiphilus SJ4]
MRSLRHQMSLLLLGSLVILAAGLISVFGWYMNHRIITETSVKAQSDLTICRELIDLKYPGSWTVRDGELYKGTVKISLNSDMVDHIAQLTGDAVTLFSGDTRTATTIRSTNGERAIGTKASMNVIDAVLKNGQMYVGDANVIGQPYQTAYLPLRADNGMIIGMLYVGIPHASEQEALEKSLIRITEIGLAWTILLSFLAWLLLRKFISPSWQEIVKGTQEPATENFALGKHSGVEEIEKLEDAFIQMAEQIQTLTGEINRSAMTNSENIQSKGNFNTIIEQFKGGETISESFPDETASFRTDPLYGLDTPWGSGENGLPKGLNKATLNQIVHYLEANHRPISTEEVAEGVKLTRVTVRRYLEFLEQQGVLKSEQKCGTVGRPVKIFIPL